jgi:choline monooxygenase
MLDIHPDIAQAWTPPTTFYTDPAIFEASRDRVFGRTWQFVTDEDSVKVPGQVYPFTLLEGCLDEPLLLTRDRDDQLHCLSNVCTHRGNLVVEGAGNVNTLRCRYHGRRFGLDGAFQFMPEFEGVAGFPAPCDDLAKAPLGKWNQLLFAAVHPVAPIEEVFAPMMERLSWLPLREFRPDPTRGREYLIKGHWALYIDNYLEGFHIPYIHAALNATLQYDDYATEPYRYGNLQLGVGKEGEMVFDLPKDSPDYGQHISAYYYWFFPNLMFNFYPWGLSINVVRPLAPDLTKVQFIPYVWDASKLGQGAGGDLDRVEREDEAVVEMVQRGMRSRFYSRGRYSVKREQNTHHFHRLLAEFLNQ